MRHWEVSYNEQTSVQSVCGEHMSCVCVGISDESWGWARYSYQKQWMCCPSQTDWTWVYCFYYILYIWCRFDGPVVGLHLGLFCSRK